MITLKNQFLMAAKLSNAIRSLEDELNVLKSKAYDNVSQKLKLFEDDFFADLNKRSDSINTELIKWKASLDERITVIANEAEDDRRKIEVKHGEDLKEKFILLTESYRDQFARIEETLKLSHDNISN